MHALKAAVLTAVTLGASQALAYNGYIDTSGKSSVVIQVGSLAGVKGYGAHFSTGAWSDGWGGYDAECHLWESNNTVYVLCWDGYQDAANHTNKFALVLDNKADVTGLTFIVRPTEVRVEATVLTTNPYTTERKPYTLSGVFPFRQSSGFWRTSPIYYQTNGVLANYADRSGFGYTIQSVFAF
jgi:hypothetical protein